MAVPEGELTDEGGERLVDRHGVAVEVDDDGSVGASVDVGRLEGGDAGQGLTVEDDEPGDARSATGMVSLVTRRRAMAHRCSVSRTGRSTFFGVGAMVSGRGRWPRVAAQTRNGRASHGVAPRRANQVS
jgi:hypothetical protein